MKCFELVQTGCYYVLKGDYARVHLDDPVILPDLQVLPGGACDVDQAAAFQAVEVRAPILSDVVQVLRANPIQQRVVQLDAAGNPLTSVMWQALPVHPKMAVLFFRGVMAWEALVQAFALYQGLPLMDQE
jgi:alpha-D-ribose 1-methylphosphonate 5-triphosphate synthase subunit PhnL